MSEKLPKIDASCPDNIMQNQIDNPSEKIFPQNPANDPHPGHAVALLSAKSGEDITSPDLSGGTLATQNQDLGTVIPKTANGKQRNKYGLFPEPPEGVDFCAVKGAELFIMTHGYPRDNPPKNIPNRRLEEDLKSTSLFSEIKKYF
jgi:hypothetical protein